MTAVELQGHGHTADTGRAMTIEALGGLDPGTRIVCGYGLRDFTDAERGRLPRDEGPVDPATIIEGPFDPANPMRILRTSAGS